jgi:hypothetical protein
MAPVGIFDAVIDLRKGVSIYPDFFGSRHLQLQVGHILKAARQQREGKRDFPQTDVEGGGVAQVCN